MDFFGWGKKKEPTTPTRAKAGNASDNTKTTKPESAAAKPGSTAKNASGRSGSSGNVKPEGGGAGSKADLSSKTASGASGNPKSEKPTQRDAKTDGASGGGSEEKPKPQQNYAPMDPISRFYREMDQVIQEGTALERDFQALGARAMEFTKTGKPWEEFVNAENKTMLQLEEYFTRVQLKADKLVLPNADPFAQQRRKQVIDRCDNLIKAVHFLKEGKLSEAENILTSGT